MKLIWIIETELLNEDYDIFVSFQETFQVMQKQSIHSNQFDTWYEWRIDLFWKFHIISMQKHQISFIEPCIFARLFDTHIFHPKMFKWVENGCSNWWLWRKLPSYPKYKSLSFPLWAITSEQFQEYIEWRCNRRKFTMKSEEFHSASYENSISSLSNSWETFSISYRIITMDRLTDQHIRIYENSFESTISDRTGSYVAFCRTRKVIFSLVNEFNLNTSQLFSILELGGVTSPLIMHVKNWKRLGVIR